MPHVLVTRVYPLTFLCLQFLLKLVNHSASIDLPSNKMQALLILKVSCRQLLLIGMPFKLIPWIVHVFQVSVHWTPRPMSTPTHDDRWQNLPRPLSSHFSLRHPPSLGLRVKSLIDCWPHCPQNETFLNINHRLAWYSLLGQYHPRQFHSLYEKVQFFINRPSPFLSMMAQEPIDFGSVIPVVSVSWYRTKQCWDSQEHSTTVSI